MGAIEMIAQRTGGGVNQADCLIKPDLGGKTYLRFSKRQELYRLGRQAASDQIVHIKKELGMK